MRALGRFGRFTLFHHLSHHPMTLAVFLFVCVGVWAVLLGFCGLFCRVLFPFCKCHGISQSSARFRPR